LYLQDRFPVHRFIATIGPPLPGLTQPPHPGFTMPAQCHRLRTGDCTAVSASM